MKNKIYNWFYAILLATIIFLPKINIINIPGTYVGIRLEDILILIFMIFFICSGKFKTICRSKNFSIKRIIIFFSIYFIFCLISTILGSLYNYINPVLGIFYSLRKLEYFLFLFVGYFFLSEQKEAEQNILTIVDLSVIFHFLIIILQKTNIIGGFINGQYLSNVSIYRCFSTFNGAYELSVYLLLILPLFIIRLFQSYKNKKKIFWLISNIILIITMIIMSQSRTSIIIMLIISILTVITMLKKEILKLIEKHKTDFLILTVLTSILIITAGCVFLPKLERFKTLNLNKMADTVVVAWNNKDFDRYLKDGFYIEMVEGADMSFAMRINKWFALIDGVSKKPLFGLGPSISKEASDGNYIRILAESGFAGFLSWMFLLIIIIKNKRIKKSNLGLFVKLGMFTLLLTAIFIDIFEASKIMMFYWFILGAVCKEFEYDDKKKLKQKKNNIRCSVAMATYNGEKYIKEQIDSVLINLNANDELIISDDGSTDQTINIIKEYQKNDSRIKLKKGPRQGVKQNFANAIKNCKGEYIFLCDQDDVWSKNKIKEILKIFEQENCLVVVHNADITDKTLKDSKENFFEYRNSGPGVIKNIWKNTYIGCCMAFHSSLKNNILPIPNDIEMHDQWIGVLGETYGESVFVDESLIKYRRHDSNVSKMEHHKLKKMLINRIKFIKNYLRIKRMM